MLPEALFFFFSLRADDIIDASAIRELPITPHYFDITPRVHMPLHVIFITLRQTLFRFTRCCCWLIRLRRHYAAAIIAIIFRHSAAAAIIFMLPVRALRRAP